MPPPDSATSITAPGIGPGPDHRGGAATGPAPVPGPAPVTPETGQTHEETLFQVMRALEAKPHTSQRELAAAMGMSLGKANYCLKALFDKGLVKMKNFRNSQNKLAYAYLLTPAGVAAKAQLTTRFLKRKIAEYEALAAEIEELKREAGE